MSLYWYVTFYYSDSTNFIVNNVDYIDDITFIQLKKNNNITKLFM